MSAAEGQIVAEMTIKTLQTLCEDKHFGLFGKKVIIRVADLNVNELTLLRN